MCKIFAPSFARMPPIYRYFYFIFSSLTLRSYSAWKQKGEPNPFTRPCYEVLSTTRSEIVSLFPSRLTSNV
jgi:hypothetical protein